MRERIHVRYGPPERVPGADYFKNGLLHYTVAYRKYTTWWENGQKFGSWEWSQDAPSVQESVSRLLSRPTSERGTDG